MNLCFFLFFVRLLTIGHSDSDVGFGYRVTLAVPTEYSRGFVGRAFIMETNQMVPNFRVALTVEAAGQNYSCSLDVLLGEARVWSSGHLSRFFTAEKCVLELTQNGDLQLKGQKERVGWRTGTSGQGVQRLQLLRTGNLVLVDAFNLIKWQSFNFPTNIVLWGQRLNVATRLTSFPSNSTSYFTFEILNDKLALYLISNNFNYAYWEYKPSGNQNITFIKVGTKGLEIYGDRYTRIEVIRSSRPEPVRFMALGNETGNLGLYYYSPGGKFEPSFKALNSTCDLPLACKPYGICTLDGVCSCIRFIPRGGLGSNCSNETIGGPCHANQVEMIEVQGVSSVLRVPKPDKIRVSKEECSNLCLNDCNCAAVLYSSGLEECYLYGVVRGVKQVPFGFGSTYMVKVPKGPGGSHGKGSGLRKWVVVVVGVADGLVILLILGGVGFYVIRKRRKSLQGAEANS
ncbi:hypothetical protein NMG60_11000092 [Bertholletia excelsa]